MKGKNHMKKLLMLFLILALTLPFVAMAEAGEPSPMIGGIDLTPIFQALIALLASLITIKVIPWIQARTTAQQQAVLQSTIKVLVFAAEQLYGAGNGKQKLLYVKSKLKDKGYNIDVDQIEAAVRELMIEGGDYHPEVEPYPIE